jgi:hypothetical protein
MMPVDFLSDTVISFCSLLSQNGGESQWNCSPALQLLPWPRLLYWCAS